MSNTYVGGASAALNRTKRRVAFRVKNGRWPRNSVGPRRAAMEAVIEDLVATTVRITVKQVKSKLKKR